MIEFQGVSFRYGGTSSPAINRIDLRVNQGDYLVIAGPSGSGKSTLLRCMNGLVPHFYGGEMSGTVTVDGIDTRQSNVGRLSQTVGMMFQDPESQFVTTSVRSEINFGQENLGRDTRETDRTTLALADSFDLTSILERPPSEISGGEKQKVVLASVVAMGTKVLVLDEPTSQLDPHSALQMMSLLKNLHRRGYTVILAEHRLSRPLRDATRTIVLESGRIVVDGEPADLVRSHRHLVHLAPVPKEERPSSDTPVIEVRGIRFGYPGQADILNGIDLHVNRSEMLSIIARNGAGKSTLARIMAGLLGPYGGVIRLLGRELRSVTRAELCRMVGIVFQDPNIHLFHDTVVEEVGFARTNMGLGMDGLDDLLEVLGLVQFRDDNPRDLSGGQKEKVAIASVMSYEPHLLILDEPTRGLDLTEKAAIMGIARSLIEEKGTAVLLLTHDLDIVEAFSDRVAILSGGTITYTGEPKKAIRRFSREMEP